MVVAIHLVKGLDSYKVSKIIDLNRKAVNDTQLHCLEVDTEIPLAVSAVDFLKDFEEIVYEEIQKSLGCIGLIKQDINHYRIESQVLEKQFYLESSLKEQIRILNKIATNKAWVAECEEHIVLINQRALVLQEQLQALSLQNEGVSRVVQ